MRVRTWIQLAMLALLACGCAFAFLPPRGPRALDRFDPDRTADLEVGMWQAYYDRHAVQLFKLLTIQMREQYHYSWARSVQTAFHFARAAARFAEMRDNYGTVLPDLEQGYAIVQRWMHTRFDPAAVARAELAWWVARRTPGQESPDTVGRRIAEEYALIYSMPVERAERSGLLRAQAGALRDTGGKDADWATVSRLLHESWRDLHDALHNSP